MTYKPEGARWCHRRQFFRWWCSRGRWKRGKATKSGRLQPLVQSRPSVGWKRPSTRKSETKGTTTTTMRGPTINDVTHCNGSYNLGRSCVTFSAVTCFVLSNPLPLLLIEWRHIWTTLDINAIIKFIEMFRKARSLQLDFKIFFFIWTAYFLVINNYANVSWMVMHIYSAWKKVLCFQLYVWWELKEFTWYNMMLNYSANDEFSWWA